MKSIFVVALLVSTAWAVAERDALLEMYQKCNGAKWPDQHNANWGTGNVCSWKGITCNPRGRVTTIDLEADNMLCQLPNSLSNFTELEVLDISSNLVGTIPEAVKSMTRLQRLKLFQNRITGTLPSWLGQLKDLKEISIVPSRPTKEGTSCDGLTGTIPDSLGDLKLEILALDDNCLTGNVPAWVKDIHFFHLRSNRFTGPCPSPSWMSPDASPNCPLQGNGPTQAGKQRGRSVQTKFQNTRGANPRNGNTNPLRSGYPTHGTNDHREGTRDENRRPGGEEQSDIEQQPGRNGGGWGIQPPRSQGPIVPILACVVFIVGLVYGYRWYRRSGYNAVASSTA